MKGLVLNWSTNGCCDFADDLDHLDMLRQTWKLITHFPNVLGEAADVALDAKSTMVDLLLWNEDADALEDHALCQAEA